MATTWSRVAGNLNRVASYAHQHIMLGNSLSLWEIPFHYGKFPSIMGNSLSLWGISLIKIRAPQTCTFRNDCHCDGCEQLTRVLKDVLQHNQRITNENCATYTQSYTPEWQGISYMNIGQFRNTSFVSFTLDERHHVRRGRLNAIRVNRVNVETQRPVTRECYNRASAKDM